MAIDSTDIPFSAPGLDIKRGTLGETADSYQMTWGGAAIIMEVTRLRRDRHELVGELSVVVDTQRFTGAKTFDNKGSLTIGDLNFSSVAARSTRSKLIQERAGSMPAGVSWPALLDEFAVRIINADRIGRPPVDLSEDRPDEPEESNETYEIQGLPILKELPTMLFGGGSSGKSYLAMFIAGELARQGIPVLYADWEFSESAHRQRFKAMFRPRPKGVFYVRCERPLRDEADRLTRIITANRIKYAICDSVAYACNHRPEDAENANEYFRAVRAMKIGSLHLAHVAASNDGEQPEKPFGCHVAETDVLTKRGWVQHPDVTLDDEVLCFDLPSSSYVWQRPSVVHAYTYDGDIIDIHTASTHCAVTPSHRMVTRPAWSQEHRQGEWQFRNVEDFNGSSQQCPASAPPIEQPDASISDDYIRFIGWWIAEGCFQDRAFGLAQAAGPLASEMVSTLQRMGMDFWTQTKQWARRPHEKPMCYIRARGSKALVFSDWLRENCGVGAAGKRLPENVWRWSPRQQRLLLNALMDGDGSWTHMTYHTVSPQLADDVQRLAVGLGHVASIRWDPPGEPHHYPRGTVKIGRPDRRTISVRTERHFSRRHYVGTVHCLTVPSGAYVTRLQGKTAITGNSIFWYNSSRSLWYIQRAAQNPSGEFRFALHHKKTNTGPLLKSRAFRMLFKHGQVDLVAAKVADIEELAYGLPLLDRIKKLLAGRNAMAPNEIADELGVPGPTVRSTLSRNESMFMRYGKKVALKVGGVDPEEEPNGTPTALEF